MHEQISSDRTHPIFTELRWHSDILNLLLKTSRCLHGVKLCQLFVKNLGVTLIRPMNSLFYNSIWTLQVFLMFDHQSFEFFFSPISWALSWSSECAGPQHGSSGIMWGFVRIASGWFLRAVSRHEPISCRVCNCYKSKSTIRIVSLPFLVMSIW